MREELIIRFNEGDKNAFNVIYNDFHDRLYYFTRRLTGDEQGKEIMLDTFMKLWNKRRDFGTYANVKAFLFITARNACYQFLNGAKRTMARADQWAYTLKRWEEMDETTGVQTELIMELYEQMKKELHEQVETLPEMARKVITMTFFEGRSTQQIAAALGIAESTVRSHRQNGIRILRNRQFLQKYLSIILIILTIAAALGKFF